MVAQRPSKIFGVGVQSTIADQSGALTVRPEELIIIIIIMMSVVASPITLCLGSAQDARRELCDPVAGEFAVLLVYVLLFCFIHVSRLIL